MKIETKCIQSGYEPKNGEPRVLPIYQSTTFPYENTEKVAQLFDLTVSGHFYSRLSNPTCEAVEKKITDMEGGIGAMLVSSGQTASALALLNIMGAGDHFIAMSSIYGGTVNLFAVSLKKLGIECTFIPNNDIKALEKAVRPNTKAVFGETIANAALTVLDVPAVAKAAHAHNIPLIVDNTFATPVLYRPIEHGADIVVHSTTKYMDGHAVAVGGVIVDSGNFEWKGNARFPEFNAPDSSYHGLIYPEAFGRAAYIAKIRVQMLRDYGTIMSPHTAFLLNLGLETLHLRIERHCENALAVARYLNKHDKVEWVKYCMLEGDSDYKKAKEIGLKGGCGVVCFGVKGGRDASIKCMDAFKMAKIVVHVADARTSVLHPASSTHRQLTDEQLLQGGIKPNMIRYSVGIEHIDDIIEDLKQALEKV